jgi:hypothetical protein
MKALMAFMMIRDQILGITHTKPIPAIEKVSCCIIDTDQTATADSTGDPQY